ncbi:MAG: multicopper oxidase domain-containing protein [Bacteroidota bacterium]
MKFKISYLPVLVVVALCTLSTSLFAQPIFNNEIPIPPLVSAVDGLIELEITQTTHKFNPANPADTVLNGTPLQPDGIGTWVYNLPGQTNMTFLGPTLKWTTNSPVNIRVINSLPASSTLTTVTTTTTHWHGAELPAQFDGGPHQPIAAEGGFWDVDFINLDSACTMWYHPHLHNQTLPHVQLGLSGIIISEQPSDLLRPTLPRTYGIDDIPLVIGEQGMSYDSAGRMYNIITEKGKRPFNVVNGVVNPYLEVPAHQVRLRILNGSTRKGLVFGLSESRTSTDINDFETYQVIATDGGYTLEPNPRKRHLMGPGARSEIVMDLSEYSVGDSLYLRNMKELMPGYIVGSPHPSEGPAGSGGGGDTTMGYAFLKLVIVDDPPGYDPVDDFTPWNIDWDPQLRDTSDVFRRRDKDLVFMTNIIQPNGDTIPKGFTIDSLTYDINVINDTICVNTKEIWTINNLSHVAHPFHIHKIFFRILGIDSTGADGTVYQLDLRERDFNGPKDDVLVLPGWRLRFLGAFDDYPSAIDPTLTYMYHCHILTHEDQEGGGMMHQFVVTDDPACAANDVEAPPTEELVFKVYPVPSWGELNIETQYAESSTVSMMDLQGKIMRTYRLPPYSGRTSLDISDIPAGMYLLHWRAADGRMITRKVVFQ